MSSELTKTHHRDTGSHALFRQEVLTERQTKWLRTVLFASPLSHRLFTLFAVFVTAAILGLLFFGHYTRKALIEGWLVPQGGLVQVFAPRTGVIIDLHVTEGAQVRKGEPLLTLSGELQSATRGATQAEIVRHLTAQRESLVIERQRYKRLVTLERRTLTARIAALQEEQEQIKHEINLQQSRLALAARTVARLREVHEGHFISDQQLQNALARKLDQDLKLRNLHRDRIAAERERLTLESRLKNLPLQSQSRIAEIERNIARIEQELAAAEAQREFVISAPQDGTVTAIQADLGGQASVTVPLLSILPAGARLEAQLYSPSRSIGFVRPGLRVLLRYDAYPYQKFGHYEGVVAHVVHSPLSTGELPSRLHGLIRGLGVREPVYRITVRLMSQTITAYGQQVPLQPGMRLEADVAIEKRRLFEWMLDPFYTLTGRTQT